uniref:Solute carrier family 30 member 2 n=1 Tax=Nothoprocta perdicaria TaxID=30464 RepID=A0A8C6ZJ33_NOTPE
MDRGVTLTEGEGTEHPRRPRRSYLGVSPKAGHSSAHAAAPDAVELGPQRGRHCHAPRAAGGHRGQRRARRKLYVAASICLVFMVGEAVEILGALLSVLSIWVVTGVLVYLAAQRLLSGDYDIQGEAMLVTSACAVAVNVVMGLALHQTGHGHSHGEQPSASVRAAFVHVLGDLLQSLGVLVASYIIYFKPEWKFVDPICTFLFSVLVLATTLSILRDVLLVLMEGTPRGMDFNAVRETLLAVRGVRALHSLHLWALTASQPLLSVHVAISDAQAVLEEARARLQGAFRFHTTTIQIESYSEDMQDCRECQSPRD